MGNAIVPGLVWSQDFRYTTRFPYGNPGDIRVISMVANETIPPGVLVQATPNGLIQIARDATRPVGISVFDPDHFDSSVIYTQGDVVPVLRAGAAFVAFKTLLPPFAPPQPCAPARANVGAGLGYFTTDSTGVLVRRCVFQFPTKDYYPGISGSPQADIPFPIPPQPIMDTQKLPAPGVALVEICLP